VQFCRFTATIKVIGSDLLTFALFCRTNSQAVTAVAAAVSG